MRHPEEPLYLVSPYIAEFWNTVSNINFIYYSLRYGPYSNHKLGYLFLANAGICSMIQHGTMLWWSWYVDMFGIYLMLSWCVYNRVWQHVSRKNMIYAALLFAIQSIDNMGWLRFIPPPNVHMLWHLNIANVAHYSLMELDEASRR